MLIGNERCWVDRERVIAPTSHIGKWIVSDLTKGPRPVVSQESGPAVITWLILDAWKAVSSPCLRLSQLPGESPKYQ